MKLDFKLIGRRVRESRMLQKISQDELAERIDMSVSYISLIENSKKKASLNALFLISNALGITINDLLSGIQAYEPDQYRTDMHMLMADCSSYEKRIIFESAQALKLSLRNSSYMFEDKIYNDP